MTSQTPIHDSLPGFFDDFVFIRFKPLGKTDFVNSVLQALYNLKPVQDFINWHHQNLQQNLKAIEKQKGMLFGHFMKIYWDSMHATDNGHKKTEIDYSPDRFLKRLSETGEEKGLHSDARKFFEFLRTNIDQSNETRKYPFSSLFAMTLHTEFVFGGASPSRMTEKLLEFDLENRKIPLLFGDQSQKAVRRQFTKIGRIFTVYLPIFDSQHRKLEGQRTDIREELQFGDGHHFRLKSAVIHAGDSLSNGHWLCVFWAHDRWVLADDDNIYGLSAEDIGGFLQCQKLPKYENVATSMLFYVASNE